MRVVSREEVLLFLVEAKRLLGRQAYTLVPRKKNLDALARLGWSEDVVLELLCWLTPENYIHGPEADRDSPGEDVWVFGAEIEGREYYLKLKLRRTEGDDYLLCLSFHEAQWPLTYPYRI